MRKSKKKNVCKHSSVWGFLLENYTYVDFTVTYYKQETREQAVVVTFLLFENSKEHTYKHDF